MLRLLLTAICTLIALQPLLRVSAAAAELPAADEVAAVELLRLSEPGSGIFAVYPEQGFSGVVVGESALYRFTPGGEYELPQRLERPTSLVQRSTGRLLVADAAQPGVFHIMRTPDTAGSRGRSITNGTGDRPLHRPASLLQELQYRTAGANGAELVVATGSLYLSDRGEDADPASGVVFYLAPSRASPTGFETRGG